ncbi:hypothetical protein [Planobispora takensis]|uniref:Uncharacterized protein n=1 Tax=Planobispora takensis TaxID=1367882 RepID=A0A8J3WVN0_9ACTN|nr:hypothetical protein [Planobispora takensis]GII03250.1 hypothetical protein Pta02_52580 [Planobispora takensis]
MTAAPPVDDCPPDPSGPPGGPRPDAPAPGSARDREWRGAVARWLPAGVTTALIVLLLGFYDVSAADTAAFAAYFTLGVTLPGTLVARALRGGGRTAAEEIAVGTALGYAIEVPAYIAARAAGQPLLVALWPAGTYALFLAVPRLRRHWRRAPGPRAPVWWSWCIALLVTYLLVWSATVFRLYDVARPGIWASDPDLMYHLALIGEVKHHMPPTVPMVAGEPLHYHWFAYAHFASASWLTGIEPLILETRLAILPLMIGLVVLVGVAGRRVTGSWAGGALAAAGTVLVKPPNLYLGPNRMFAFGGLDTTWDSCTQAFGAFLFAAVVLLLPGLLGRERGGAGRWLLWGVLMAVLSGAKAAYLPLLGGGLAAVIAVELVRRRRVHVPAVAALATTGVCLLFTQFVMFGGRRMGMAVDPLYHTSLAWRALTGRAPEAGASPAGVLDMTVIYLLCWAVALCGVSVLLTRARPHPGPALPLLLGIGAGGVGGTLLFAYPGLGQVYFVMGAHPCLMLAAACGIVAAVRRARPSPRALAAAVAAGVTAAYAIPVLCDVRVPISPVQDDDVLYRPYIALVLVAAVAAAVLSALAGRARAGALVIVMLSAVSLPTDLHTRLLPALEKVVQEGPRRPDRPAGEQAMPPRALAALRWLRENSRPEEPVATNANWDGGDPVTRESTGFWTTAYAERRVLLEGWAFTAGNMEHWRPGRPVSAPYWDRERLLANRRVFEDPSPSAVRHLAERYGVRWLFVDERRAGTGAGARLAEAAVLRFRSGDFSLYSLPAAAGQ